MKLRKNTTYLTFGELGIGKKNASHFDKNIARVFYNNFFINLEKNRFVQSQIRKLIIEEKELTEQNEINNNIFTFYQNLFSKQADFKQNDLINNLDKINLPVLSNG